MPFPGHYFPGEKKTHFLTMTATVPTLLGVKESMAELYGDRRVAEK